MGYTFILILFALFISTEVVKCTSVCSVNGYAAFCAFKGLQEVPELPTYVKVVDLSFNSIAELNESSFSRLEGLQVLNLEQQTPGLVIRNNTFRRLSNLRLLQLDYNNYLKIETGAFNGLSNLEILTLTQCSLNEAILSGDFLKPLVSLEMLDLRENNIQRIQPASFFLNMRRFHWLDLSRNKLKSICEEELLGFQGKHFTLLKLSSVTLQDMNEYWLGWDKCGKPFKNMSMTSLDLSGNGFNVNVAKRFFDAITGTKIQNLILSNSYSMGSSFGHNNFKDPDKFTFKGLEASGITIFDLSQSKIFALSNSVFTNFPELEQITLAQNEINIIETDAFLGMTNLLKLNLSKNFLSSIDSNTFQNLEKLEVLDLSYNHIRVLGDKSFQGLPNLIILNLTGNALESVDEFATLLNLKILYLGENRISSLSGLPNIAKNLTTLDLEFNRLKDLSDVYTILWEFPLIEQIFLQGNKFSSCYNQRLIVASDKLQLLHLGLSTMQLIWSEGKCLNVFNNLHQLEQLSLTANGLQSLPQDIFKDLTSLFFLDLSFNSLKYLPNGVFPESLRILNLEYNSIYSVDPNLFSSLHYISLIKNDFRCDCKLRDFQTWLNQTNVTIFHPIEDVTCASPEDQYMVPVVRSNIHCEDEEDERRSEKLRLVLFIFCFTLVILLTASAIIYVRRRGYIFKFYKKLTGKLVDGKREEPDPEQFLYDVYLCFSSSDMRWVERALLNRLDSQFSEQNTLRCCFEERDFIPGEDHLTNMRNAIQNSRKTLCVVSEHFLKDGWCLETFTLAQRLMEVELKDILVVLVVGNIPQYRLMKFKQVRSYIENRKYLQWPDDIQDLEWFYDQLLHEIRKDTKVNQTNQPTNQTKPEALNVHANTAVDSSPENESLQGQKVVSYFRNIGKHNETKEERGQLNSALSPDLRMAKHRLSLILLGLCISTQIVKCTSVCSIAASVAFCIDKGLQEVPKLSTHVNKVDLSNNSIAELNETSFSLLDGLQALILMHQKPGLVIRNNTFITLANLTSLRLDYNRFLKMDTGAFNGLFNLKNLTLTQCSLNEAILSGDFLKPLVSLEMLDLRENNIQRIQPASFFLNMRRLHWLDLSRNKLKSICEEELLGFQGKHFTLLKLSSVTLQDMNEYWLGWDKCGKPFKNMSMTSLDLSGNGFNVNMAKRFFNAITGTKIQSLILSNSYSMGKSSGNNSKDPDKFTFKGLEASGIKIFDLTNSSIFALSNSVFSYLSSLEQITMAESHINKIENRAFWGMTNLLKLNLSKNFLGNIDANTFQNLEKLEVLDLSYNHIWILGFQSFLGLPNLLNLNLTGNALKAVHRFATLPNLEKLYLGDNKITSVYSLPHISKNLTTLYLQFNKFSSMSVLYTILEEFPQIVEIVFRGNELVYCPNDGHNVLSQKVQILDLAFAGLEVIWSEGKCLNVFNDLHQLEQLFLSSNLLQSLPQDIFKDLTSLFLLDLSFNSLKYLPNDVFPESLRILNLEYNSIYSVDPNLFSSLHYISLIKNDFRCDCKLRDFQTWLNQTNVTIFHPIEDVTCASPEDQYMVPVVRSNIHCEDEEDERRSEKLRLVLFIFCSALVILLTASAIIYVHGRGYIFKFYKKLTGKLVDGKREEPDPEQFLYDVYLCFSSSDMKWVERALLNRLDSQFSEQNTLRCCFEERDFIPGEDHLTNMRNAIQNSRKTLCVVSERFLKDGWCLETFTLAQCRMLLELKDILVVLVVGNIPQYRLMKYEQVRSYIENRRYLLWPDDIQDLEWFYDQLLHKIRKNTKLTQTNTKVNEVEKHLEEANVLADTAV
ncbi:LOW QUALITY PROTEIN: uncharacterized protein LOC120492058 [Pimephales promelas]|uniref:LOW QUALITY PROTEIN: uncharacterized protein LOC120492058 n=1 Tax=Pimephales promelas TaxID=90988 RepID=UPI001955875A|nr:LOW QUALITY PROTEIN: uncharacterized protein LOC120492058 [Pimephales promelas]